VVRIVLFSTATAMMTLPYWDRSVLRCLMTSGAMLSCGLTTSWAARAGRRSRTQAVGYGNEQGYAVEAGQAQVADAVSSSRASCRCLAWVIACASWLARQFGLNSRRMVAITTASSQDAAVPSRWWSAPCLGMPTILLSAASTVFRPRLSQRSRVMPCSMLGHL